MKTSFENKSTLDEIRERFDHDVERFSQLETGQQATLDAPLILQLVAQSCRAILKPGDHLLDIGCGAGNFTLRVLHEVRGLHCHLADLSQPMLDRARERITPAGATSVTTHQGDFRKLDFGETRFDAILAGAVLHHLRNDADWATTFAKLYSWLKPGGRLYVSDFVCFDLPDLQEIQWKRYGDYLVSLKGEKYRDAVFAYIDKEDSPRSLPYQLDLLKATSFRNYEILHRNGVGACYVGVK
jgi:tRNA (cmo5U34)-methyltransferase